MAGWEWLKRFRGAKSESKSYNGSGTTNGIPSGTNPQSAEDHVLRALDAVNVRNFSTLKDVALAGAKGEPINDKTYLMERIIQLTADLPLHDKVSDSLTNNFLSELWNDLQHPPKSYLGYDYAFRKPDGSNNNILWPQIGAAGQPYARTVTAKKMQPAARPDPGVIFDSVLARKKFEPHPNGISSVLFYLASIIIHDCFHTSHADFAISETSSYLDLAPLYGSSAEQQMSVRTKKDGKLKPDCFADARILGFPPGVGCMLIMFNRFHNHVATNLACIDEHERFSSILRGRGGFKGLKRPGDVAAPTPDELYDEALFQTARLVTTGLYVNIILKDYVRTILNLNRTDSLWNLDPRSDQGKAIFGHKIPEATGNQVAAEFNLVYRWHSCISERDAKWTEEAMNIITKGEKEISFPKLVAALVQWSAEIPKEPLDRNFNNMKRQPDGRFSDQDLTEIWASSVEDIAGAFGAAHVPPILKFVEVLGMIQARSWNLASLNEFREYFRLKPHDTFESINPDPDVAKQLRHLYGHPDNVEIYPGIVVEAAKKPMEPGSGLCASFTTSRAILSDAVSLVRSDRFYTIDYTPQNLTNWGFHAADTDLDIDHGCVFYKLILNAFPSHFSTNSVYAHYPLVIPKENSDILRGLKRDQLYTFERPALKQARTYEPHSSSGQAAIKDSANYIHLWTERAVGFGGPAGKTMTNTSFAKAFMANETWMTVTTKYYTETLERLWSEKQYDLCGHQTIDVVGEVLNTAHLGFTMSILGVGQAKHSKTAVLSTFGHVFEQAYGNAQPSSLNAKVRVATNWLASAIVSQITGSSGSRDVNGTKTSQLGSTAYLKLTEAGSNAVQAAWQDVLPASALLLNTLCRLSAQTVEYLLDEKTHLTEVQSLTAESEHVRIQKLAQEITRYSSNIAFAMKRVDDGNTPGRDPAQQDGQQVFLIKPMSQIARDGQDPNDFRLDREESAYSVEAYGPEMELAYRVAFICNTVMTGILGRAKGVERMPGPQGRLKQITDEAGNLKYLNAEETEYVPYPVSLKVRWKEDT